MERSKDNIRSQNPTNLESSVQSGDSLISLEECKKYLEKYALNDQRIISIKNNLIGIVDSVINSYLDDFN